MQIQHLSYDQRDHEWPPKRRAPDVYRELPVPPALIIALAEMHINDPVSDQLLWDGSNRVTKNGWIKATMDVANITGLPQGAPSRLWHSCHGIRHSAQIAPKIDGASGHDDNGHLRECMWEGGVGDCGSDVERWIFNRG